MYDSDRVSDNSERTAFRRAEKKYKLYYNDSKPSKRQKQPRPVDLSEVVDFKLVLESFHQNGETPPGIFKLQCDFNRPVFCFEDRPGFYFIPGALSIEEQCHWIRESLTSFPQPPNRTNHNEIYGPIHDLFFSAQKQKVLVAGENLDRDTDSGVHKVDACKWKFSEIPIEMSRGDSCTSIAGSNLLRKLRWSTLGLQFDWSKVDDPLGVTLLILNANIFIVKSVGKKSPPNISSHSIFQRNYNISLPHNKIPETLCELSTRMAAPAMPMGKEFQPEAAIVNYFGLGDMLGGHLDDMEADWTKPIVSMSLGCKAIFLLGGKSREDLPVAMFLRSGDIVLMAGEARECFHGVPRIFTDKENAEVTPLSLQLSHQDDLCFMEYIRTSRININIRQVF
ncbi:hypothetical protein HHK36_015832 [Tetracentron sinense]|uniref:Fe2OG dioxygenase domain-containing protein n=1 Tax=Tetracentron sinense TaxID=13715 RepID=A0A834Z5W8_TETSI|nr:hypothetical protein HHK36_015832 [Tetracentron sinense]